jgi:hypothetical protein
MLVALGARERTRQQFETLLRSAGLAPLRLVDTGAAFQILEARA